MVAIREDRVVLEEPSAGDPGKSKKKKTLEMKLRKEGARGSHETQNIRDGCGSSPVCIYFLCGGVTLWAQQASDTGYLEDIRFETLPVKERVTVLVSRQAGVKVELGRSVGRDDFGEYVCPGRPAQDLRGR